MSEKAYQNVGAYVPENLIADGVNPINTKAVKIATGTSTFTRGTLINTNGTICATSDTPVGILCEEVVQDGAVETESIMYISGSFYKDAVVVDAGASIDDFEIELQKLGIFLR